MTETMLQRAKSWFKEVREELPFRLDTDSLLQVSMGTAIEMAATRYAMDTGARWTPGQPLKLLLAGYSGSRNTGADVRVEEIIRQFRHLCGDDHLELSITTIDPTQTRNYFKTVRQLHIPKIFPKFLYDTVVQHHGVVSCEGSMFKSKFANALSTMMAGALGLAVVENKLAVGYGGEAGTMDDSLREFVRKYCQGAYIIARNEESQHILADLDIRTDAGTDTAWTFEPAPAATGQKLLKDAGWDGQAPLLAICPINPFWWPVRADVNRAVVHHFTGAHDDAHYDSVYFHKSGPEVDAAQERYLQSIATAVNRFRAETGAQPILIGMEMLDRTACETLNTLLNEPCPMFISDAHDMYEMVSILHQCNLVVSSRYHALVTSMPGLVPSIGITMDERIRNLMKDREHPELALEVDDEHLADNLYTQLSHVHAHSERYAFGIGKCVYRNLYRMGEMGGRFVDYIREMHPEFPFESHLGSHGDPWDHLPPLSPQIQAIVDKHTKASSGSYAAPASATARILPTME